MYLAEFEIEQIKCFERVKLSFPQRADGDYGGWNVILGGNGSGKSTLLQAMAYALVGPLAGPRLLTNPSGWTRNKEPKGEFRATVVPQPGDKLRSSSATRQRFSVDYAVIGDVKTTFDKTIYDQPQIVERRPQRSSLASSMYATKLGGWFSCGYGPFRRFNGQRPSGDAYFREGRQAKEIRFATLFDEESAVWSDVGLLSHFKALSYDSEKKNAKVGEQATLFLQTILNELLPGHV